MYVCIYTYIYITRERGERRHASCILVTSREGEILVWECLRILRRERGGGGERKTRRWLATVVVPCASPFLSTPFPLSSLGFSSRLLSLPYFSSWPRTAGAMSSTVPAGVSPKTAAVAAGGTANFITARRRIAESIPDVEKSSSPGYPSEEEDDGGCDGSGVGISGFHHHHRARTAGKRPWWWRRSVEVLLATVVSAVCLATVLLAAHRLKVTGAEEDGGHHEGWFNGNSVIHGGASDQNNVVEEVTVVHLRGDVSTATAVSHP